MEPEHKTKNLLNQKPNSRKKWVPKQCETSFQSTLQVQGHIETRSWIRLISQCSHIHYQEDCGLVPETRAGPGLQVS